jgi:hypothetical protein
MKKNPVFSSYKFYSLKLFVVRCFIRILSLLFSLAVRTMYVKDFTDQNYYCFYLYVNQRTVAKDQVISI